jgi:hypothetical protein
MAPLEYREQWIPGSLVALAPRNDGVESAWINLSLAFSQRRSI